MNTETRRGARARRWPAWLGACSLVLGATDACSESKGLSSPGHPTNGGTAGVGGASGSGAGGRAASGGVGTGGRPATGGEGGEGGEGGDGATSTGGMSGRAGSGTGGSGGAAGTGNFAGEGGEGGEGGDATAGEGGMSGTSGTAGTSGTGGEGGGEANPCAGGGKMVWAKPLARLGNGSSIEARAVSAFADSSVVVAGLLRGGSEIRFGAGTPNELSMNAAGAFWARFDENGEFLAARRATSAYAEAVGVHALSDGSFVFAGYFQDVLTFDYGLPTERMLRSSRLTDLDPFVARIGDDGAVTWALNGAGADSTFARALDVLPNGNIVLAGTGTVTFDDGQDSITTGSRGAYIAVFSPSGEPLWARSYAANINHLEALDDGSIALTGTFRASAGFDGDPEVVLTGSANDDSLFVARYLADGTLAFAKQATDRSVGFGVVSSDRDELLVTGFAEAGAVFGPGEANETTVAANAMVIARYSSTGALISLNTTNDLYEFQSDIVRTSEGALVTTGWLYSAGRFGGETLSSRGWQDVFTMCQSPTGDFGWVSHTASTQNDFGRSVTLLPTGDIVATGQYRAEATAAFGTPDATVLPIDIGSTGSYVIRHRP